MSKYKQELFELARDRLAYTELEGLGIDCTEEIAAINKQISVAKKRLDRVDDIEYYQDRKRWKPGTGLTDSQKKKIRDIKGLHSDSIAGEVFN